ncbi:VWD domain-containing protein [Allorhizocola rhizosphaerae]|uniref:VWD domain-containing protein n=1 Tax=Allorhizocola rhizosphaerae TaxID=1872709 RepID=UPI0013C3406A|nr:VWD domain-containing protein [Allorhizocola rhizosphaerae]
MKPLPHRLVGATLLAVLLITGAPAGVAQSAPATTENLQAWHMRIAKVPQPSAKGCFTAGYPRLTWRETACAAPPTTPMTPRPPGPTPLTVGNGNHIVAQAPAGLISQAYGTFENVMGVASVSSPLTPMGPSVANAYTLQLNTNFFNTPACAGALNPALCLGWQQFVFANDGTSGLVYIEYWLLMYDVPCPGGWSTFMIGSSIYCRQATPAAIVPGNTPITNMPSFMLSGDVSGANDIVVFQNGMNVYTTSGTSIVDAGPGWTMAEFNVFGYGSGTTATFNAGASTHVRTRINYGGTAAPNCLAVGFTSETNNLNFGLPKPPATPPGPAIIFLENMTGGAVTNCDSAESVGDTHQHTFAGLLYDFQASGDFVEAQVGSSFEVQTRKVSGAPMWPNASVNRSVATRMGNTRVALCDGTKLVVDGQPRSLAPGGSLWLPSGVDIHRVGSNVYYVRDQSGNSIRVTANTNYVNVKVGLGTWPTTVRGLLGNPNNDPNRLEARDGTQFTIPISFNDLYNRFGASWRVNPFASLFLPCSSVASGNPSAPFYAGNLDPTVRQRAEAACRQAGVAQVWLDTCTLDAAVIGPDAARVFVGMEPPVVNGNRPQT